MKAQVWILQEDSVLYEQLAAAVKKPLFQK